MNDNMDGVTDERETDPPAFVPFRPLCKEVSAASKGTDASDDGTNDADDGTNDADDGTEDADSDDAFDQSEWEREQMRITAMFSGMYTAADGSADSSDGAEAEADDGLTTDVKANSCTANAVDSDAAPRPGLQDDCRLPSVTPDVSSALSDVAPGFAAVVPSLAPLVKSLLLGEEKEPASVSVDALLRALGRQESCARRSAHKKFEVMRVQGVVPPTACAMLREAVDRERCTVADSVDGLPEHQLRLSVEALTGLVGADEYARLARLPVEWVHAENASLGGEPLDEEVAERFGRLQARCVHASMHASMRASMHASMHPCVHPCVRAYMRA